MLEDTLDFEDNDEIEEEADAEVEKVLFEITDGKLGNVGTVGPELPVRTLHLLNNTIFIDNKLVTGSIGRAGSRKELGTISEAT